MVQYADYKYYTETYRGVSVPMEEFERICRRANAFVREITFNRVDEENITDDVKDAVCAVCDVWYAEEEMLKQTGGKEVKSENTDGYTVTYVTEGQDGQNREESFRRKLYLTAKPRLAHTGLLYVGVNG